MKTNELIVHLAKSAGPVSPLRSPWIRLAQWMACATALAAAAILAIGPRADLSSAITRPVFAVSLFALLLAAVLSAATAFVLSVPGMERSPLERALPIVAAVGWPAAWLIVMKLNAAGRGNVRIFHAACAIEIAVLAALSGWLLVAMLRRAAPLRPAWTAAIASLAAVTIAAAATQIICPIDAASHQLVGHVLVAAVVGLAGFMAARRPLGEWNKK